MKERIIWYTKKAAGLALRIISAIIALFFFILFYGVLAAVGMPARAKHGDFEKGIEAYKGLVEGIELLIQAAGAMVFLILIDIYLMIKGCVLYVGHLIMVISRRERKFKTLLEFSKEYAEKHKVTEEKAKVAAKYLKMENALKKEETQQNSDTAVLSVPPNSKEEKEAQGKEEKEVE